MEFRRILAPFAAALATALLTAAGPAAAQSPPGARDDVIVEMNSAFKRADKRRLAVLLPQARGHALEPWAAYWELRARLQEAMPGEVQDFLARYAGTYQEDRLRNDWLLLLGQRRDWDGFAAAHPNFRMGDDRAVQCYALIDQVLRAGAATAEQAEAVRSNWFAQRDADDGCTFAADRLISGGALPADVAWRKARLSIEANRPRAARDAVLIVAPEAVPLVDQLNGSPTKFLTGRIAAASKVRQEVATLALVKMAVGDHEQAAAMMDSWGPRLTREERNWVWGAIGRQAATRLSPDAMTYFGNVSRDADLSDDMLGWKVRAALRAGKWKEVVNATAALSPAAQRDPTWIYWRARAVAALARNDRERAEAAALLQEIAGPRGFYEQLALEDLGQPITVPPPPLPLTEAERQAARANPHLNRGLYAIAIGLRSEGVREWNYGTNLHDAGGLGERELLAAAELACQRQVWDRCINTSERTRESFDAAQRFPMPFRDAVVQRSTAIGLDPSYVYGLIRQESRFIMDARSGVGASGLMQVMPATARWTANKIGLTGFRPEQINDRDTNIAIGTAYLKLALDDFQGSMPLAAAAYNAGPGRPRNWRNGPVLDAAIWAENVPFTETRDYVKKVLSNATLYAAILTGQPQSLRARLGTVGPREATTPEVNRDLP